MFHDAKVRKHGGRIDEGLEAINVSGILLFKLFATIDQLGTTYRSGYICFGLSKPIDPNHFKVFIS